MSSNYLSVEETCGSCSRPIIPSMKVQLVPETFTMGYQSLTHGVTTSNNYQNFTNAYFLNQVPSSGYKFEKRVCNGDVLYPTETTNIQISKSMYEPKKSGTSFPEGIPLNNISLENRSKNCAVYDQCGLDYCECSGCCEDENKSTKK